MPVCRGNWFDLVSISLSDVPLINQMNCLATSLNEIHYKSGMCSWPGLETIKRSDKPMHHFDVAGEKRSSQSASAQQQKKKSFPPVTYIPHVTLDFSDVFIID